MRKWEKQKPEKPEDNPMLKALLGIKEQLEKQNKTLKDIQLEVKKLATVTDKKKI